MGTDVKVAAGVVAAPVRKNAWWKVLLRILAGAAVSVGAFFLGNWIGDATGVAWLAWMPLLLVFLAGLFVAIKFRRFGYTTGVGLGFVSVVVVAFLMFFLACLKSLILYMTGH